MTRADDPTRPLADALAALEHVVFAADFGLQTRERERLRTFRDRVGEEAANHRARLADLDAPLLVVLGGVTGAGKSTVTNTLVGERVVAAGVIRPTTSVPTLIAHPDDVAQFRSDRVLGGLARVEADADAALDGEVLRVLAHPGVPVGVAMVDAPDIDSVSDHNRLLADLLLDAADLWVWFTSVTKYADEDSMRYLTRAAERDTALAIVLTQVRDADREPVVADLREKLAAAGLGQADLHVVAYAEVADDRLPAVEVAPLRALIERLADPEVRRQRRVQTLRGAVAVLPAAAEELAEGIEAELDLVRRLSAAATAANEEALREVDHVLDQGLPLRDAVLDRWNGFVGTSGLLRLAEGAGGRARTWISTVLGGTTDNREKRLEREVRLEVSQTLERLIVESADVAASQTVDAWSREPAGRALVGGRSELRRASPEVLGRAGRLVRDWQDHVTSLVETQGAERRTTARWLSTLINAAATGAIVVALAHTGGLTGAEAGLATAAGAANQALLVKLFGEQNLRTLVRAARVDLRTRITDLLGEERHRFIGLLADAAPDPDLPDRLREAASAVASAEVPS